MGLVIEIGSENQNYSQYSVITGANQRLSFSFARRWFQKISKNHCRTLDIERELAIQTKISGIFGFFPGAKANGAVFQYCNLNFRYRIVFIGYETQFPVYLSINI